MVIFEEVLYATHFQTSQVGILHFRETASEFQGESKQTRYFHCYAKLLVTKVINDIMYLHDVIFIIYFIL